MVRHIDELASEEQRSRSNMVTILLQRALEDGGDQNPRLVELATAYLLGFVGADEAMREIAALVLAPSAADGWQLKLELPTPA